MMLKVNLTYWFLIIEVVEPPSDVWTPPDGRPWYPATCQAYKLSDAHYLNFFGFTMLTADSGKPGEPEYIFRFNPQVNRTSIISISQPLS